MRGRRYLSSRLNGGARLLLLSQKKIQSLRPLVGCIPIQNYNCIALVSGMPYWRSWAYVHPNRLSSFLQYVQGLLVFIVGATPEGVEITILILPNVALCNYLFKRLNKLMLKHYI
jgi:hypothetical protein